MKKEIYRIADGNEFKTKIELANYYGVTYNRLKNIVNTEDVISKLYNVIKEEHNVTETEIKLLDSQIALCKMLKYYSSIESNKDKDIYVPTGVLEQLSLVSLKSREIDERLDFYEKKKMLYRHILDIDKEFEEVDKDGNKIKFVIYTRYKNINEIFSILKKEKESSIIDFINEELYFDEIELVDRKYFKVIYGCIHDSIEKDLIYVLQYLGLEYGKDFVYISKFEDMDYVGLYNDKEDHYEVLIDEDKNIYSVNKFMLSNYMRTFLLDYFK